MNALEHLRQDHQQVSRLLEQLEGDTAQAAAGRAQSQTLDRLVSSLVRHLKREEGLLYPILDAFPQMRDLIQQSCQDHQQVRDILGQIRLPDPAWQAKLKDLKAAIALCVAEEEARIFPQAEHLLAHEQLQELGRQMKLPGEEISHEAPA